MSRLKIDFETEDTAVVCELADMLRRLHGKEGHTCCQPPPAFQYMKDVDTIVRDTAEKTFGDSIALPPNPFAAQLPDAPLPVNDDIRTVILPGNLVDPAAIPLPDFPFDAVLTLTPAPPPAGAAVELDAEGLPWDGRIHSSSKAKLAKTGCWKLARGCDPTLAASVTAELKAVMALPAAPQVATPPTCTPLVTTPPPPYLPPVPTTENSGAPNPPLPAAEQVLPLPGVVNTGGVSVAPPPPVSTAVAPPTTFPAFLVAVTQQQAAKRITFDEVLAVLKEHGLENIQLLTARPDLIPAVYARLEGIWLTRG